MKRSKRARIRKCGDCQVCCHDITVVSLKKPARQDCPHQCATGCAIYNDRPSECAAYSCAWKFGFFPQDWRPDLIGVCAEITHVPLAGKKPITVIHAWESSEGSLRKVKDQLIEMANGTTVLMIDDQIYGEEPYTSAVGNLWNRVLDGDARFIDSSGEDVMHRWENDKALRKLING